MGNDSWDLIIDADKNKGKASYRELWDYRDLMWLLVRRDVVSFYKQTILGPIWFLIKPVFSSLVYLFVFGELAGLSTDGIPSILFYLSGVTLWSFFSETLSKTSTVLTANASMFGKVYFPRLIMPISIIFSNLVTLIIQVIVLALIYGYYCFFSNSLNPNLSVLLAPLIVFIIALQASGLGLLFSAITIKYRDATMLLGYIISLGLFVTPVVYPLSSLSGIFRDLSALNPMTFPIELFRNFLFGTGTFTEADICYMLIVTFSIAITGFLVFNRAERSFVDTV